MILEITGWAALFTLVSWTLPLVVPYFRNKLQLIKSVPTVVFDSTCIQDVHQTRIDAIDRSVGQLMAATGQLLLTGWACLNLLGLHAYESLDEFVIGYYIYDIFHLLTKPYAKTQRIFLVHHGLTIFLVVYLYVLDIPYYVPMNILYMMLEVSGAVSNITNLLTHTYPSSHFVIPCSFVNVSVYGTTRIILYPLVVVYLVHYTYVATTTTYSYCLCLPPLGMLFVLYGAYIYWYIGMVTKHRALKEKRLL
jgi:hypothetical protein